MNSVPPQAYPLPHFYAYLPPLSCPSAASSFHPQPALPQHLSSTNPQPTSILSGTIDAYMNPTLPPPVQHYYQQSPHHGIKRSAPQQQEDEIEQSNHISHQLKRLRLNNISNNNNHINQNVFQPGYYHHHSRLPHAPHPPPQGIDSGDATVLPLSPPSTQPLAVPTLPSNDFMTIDETPHKIYVADLDAEIAQIEAAEHEANSQLFLPDVDKQIGAIPDHVLRGSTTSSSSLSSLPPTSIMSPTATVTDNPTMGIATTATSTTSTKPHQALILYQDPSSISVPEEEDAVRKAILDSRRSIREKMRKEQQRERETAHLNLCPGMGYRPDLGLGLLEHIGRNPPSRSISENSFGLVGYGGRRQNLESSFIDDTGGDDKDDDDDDDDAMDIE